MGTRYSRKDFMKLFGAGTVAMVFSNRTYAGPERSAAPIAVQLYTVRKEIEQDFNGTMRRVAEIGFLGIETYTLPSNVTPEKAGKVFRELGIEVVGMHTELPAGAQREELVKMAEIYQSRNLIYAGWPQAEKYKDLDAMKRTAETYNEAASYLKTKGLRLGLHNHWWEFEAVEGIRPFYYLLDYLSPEVFFEIDTYWVKVGGQNPAKVVGDFGNRAPLLHIKDGPAVKGDKSYEQVPAGTGAMDFPSIVKAAGKNTNWMIVEFDGYDGDIFEGMQNSYRYLTKNGLAKGRA